MIYLPKIRKVFDAKKFVAWQHSESFVTFRKLAERSISNKFYL
ncbi:hypothetical protein J2Y60_001217 [Arcicella sp. BE140]|nr:hypothetical protein [Arcicella sp. BE51]MDR6811028.1 hypothetical protein [Arcicella sp. BE140]MDR6822378.1 hypothetical protein [Arcicella sp. BE139]